MGSVRLRRVYDAPDLDDGARILVDRLWPRGVSKADARLDAWVRQLGPSDELRRWFGHDPDRFEEFRERYLAELEAPERGAIVDDLVARAGRGAVTILTATRDVEHCHAAVVLAVVRGRLRGA